MVVAAQQHDEAVRDGELHLGLLQHPVELLDCELLRRLLLGQLRCRDKPLHGRLRRGEPPLLHLAKLQEERSACLGCDDSGQLLKGEAVERGPIAERSGEAAAVGEQLVAKGPGGPCDRGIQQRGGAGADTGVEQGCASDQIERATR